jgi:hypothetical protein
VTEVRPNARTQLPARTDVERSYRRFLCAFVERGLYCRRVDQDRAAPVVPPFVYSPLFPFEGELRVKDRLPPAAVDAPRAGEPGGGPCPTCTAPEGEFLWANENWLVSPGPRAAVKQVFLMTRDHVDMSDMPAAVARELGPTLQRVEAAMIATGEVGRVHVHRWGDGSSHFHLWLYGRPLGERQLLGVGLVLWAMSLPSMPQAGWDAAMAVIGASLAAQDR